MIKDTIKTKSWRNKIKVWFSKTYWRPEDCIEEKNSNDFYKKFNPEISPDVKFFGIVQMFFITVVPYTVLFFASLHTYFEIVLFGISVITLATLSGHLMQGNRAMYQMILIFSVISLFGINYYELLNLELISTKLFNVQLAINILLVTGIYFFQSLTNLKILKAK
jgi:hypothetical protein